MVIVDPTFIDRDLTLVGLIHSALNNLPYSVFQKLSTLEKEVEETKDDMAEGEGFKLKDEVLASFASYFSEKMESPYSFYQLRDVYRKIASGSLDLELHYILQFEMRDGETPRTYLLRVGMENREIRGDDVHAPGYRPGRKRRARTSVKTILETAS